MDDTAFRKYAARRQKCPNCGSGRLYVRYTEESVSAAQEAIKEVTDPTDYSDSHRVFCLNPACRWSGIVDSLFP